MSHETGFCVRTTATVTDDTWFAQTQTGRIDNQNLHLEELTIN